MARRLPINGPFHLRAGDNLTYAQTVCTLEEAIGIAFPNLYQEAWSLPTTIASFSEGNVVGGIIYFLQEGLATIRFLGVKKEFRENGRGEVLLDRAEYAIRRTNRQLVQVDSLDSAVSWYMKRGYTYTQKWGHNSNLLQKRLA
jgi:GNAT superfamily N-acetyltransferase